MKSIAIQRCPNCILRVIPGQGIRWICDDFHPEVLAQIQPHKIQLTDQEPTNEQLYLLPIPNCERDLEL